LSVELPNSQENIDLFEKLKTEQMFQNITLDNLKKISRINFLTLKVQENSWAKNHQEYII
jgi:hypothetical protein